MGVEGGNKFNSGSSDPWSETFSGGVFVVVELAECPMGVRQLKSASQIPGDSPLIYEIVFGLMATHALQHSEKGIPKGSCHKTGHHTQRAG